MTGLKNVHMNFAAVMNSADLKIPEKVMHKLSEQLG